MLMAVNGRLERQRVQNATLLHFVWIKDLCHKMTFASEQDRGHDPLGMIRLETAAEQQNRVCLAKWAANQSVYET